MIACGWAALAPPPGGSDGLTFHGRQSCWVGRAQAADCMAVKMGPWRKDRLQPMGLCALSLGRWGTHLRRPQGWDAPRGGVAALLEGCPEVPEPQLHVRRRLWAHFWES